MPELTTCSSFREGKCSTNHSVAFGYAVLTDVPTKGKGGVLWESVGGTVFSTFELDF